MNDLENGVEQEQRRDEELDLLLAPLRKPHPSDSIKDQWLRSITHKKQAQSPVSIKRRLVEWSIAASIGFVAASLFFKYKDHQDFASSNNQEYFDLDATEMHLVAKSD